MYNCQVKIFVCLTMYENFHKTLCRKHSVFFLIFLYCNAEKNISERKNQQATKLNRDRMMMRLNRVYTKEWESSLNNDEERSIRKAELI